MLMRFLSETAAIVDGLDLSRFRLGRVYDLSAALASYLMATGVAVPVLQEAARAVSVTRKPDRRKTPRW